MYKFCRTKRGFCVEISGDISGERLWKLRTTIDGLFSDRLDERVCTLVKSIIYLLMRSFTRMRKWRFSSRKYGAARNSFSIISSLGCKRDTNVAMFVSSPALIDAVPRLRCGDPSSRFFTTSSDKAVLLCHSCAIFDITFRANLLVLSKFCGSSVSS